VHLGLVTCGVYRYLITHFGRVVLKPESTLIIQILITSINNVVVRGLFALRVWRLSRWNRPLVFMIAVLIMFTFAGATVFVSKVLKIESFFHIHQFDWVLYMSLSTGAFCDVLVCVSLCVILHRSRTGWPRTDSFITAFSLYAINTGVLITLCSVLTLLTFALLPDTMTYIAIYFCMDSVFFNALLATLNARTNLRERLGIPTIHTSTQFTGTKRRSVASGAFVRVEHPTSGQSPRTNSTSSSELRKLPFAYHRPTSMIASKSFELPMQSVPIFNTVEDRGRIPYAHPRADGSDFGSTISSPV